MERNCGVEDPEQYPETDVEDNNDKQHDTNNDQNDSDEEYLIACSCCFGCLCAVTLFFGVIRRPAHHEKLETEIKALSLSLISGQYDRLYCYFMDIVI